MSLANPLEVARAISAVAAPFVSALNEEEKSSSAEHRVSWTRRDFVATTLAAAFALALRPLEASAERVGALNAPRSPLNTRRVTLNVNGREIALDIEPRVTLLDALREYAGLTGTKKGCDHGQCGACTVHVDGRRALSCMTFAVMQEGHRITTIEGLASGERLHPMQQAFITHDGFQCGYCTSGQIMSAVAVLDESWGPADDDVREAMSGNICRCGAYPGIVAALQDVRRAQASNGGGRTQ
jgi:xanthine dehydrogenase YagT iron-sulfur-binding subunit